MPEGMVYRPMRFDDFNGQLRTRRNLEISVVSAHRRDAPVPHVLISGPPGLGKTTLAKIIANERAADFTELNATAIEKPADLVGPLLGAQRNSVVFIDEIHALKAVCEEFLYTVMEDRLLTIPVGDGQKPIVTHVEPFTLVGATTREGMLTGPLLDRFQMRERLQLYNDEEMLEVVDWTLRQFAETESVTFDEEVHKFIVPFCHGVARHVQHFAAAMRDTAVFLSGIADIQVDLDIAGDTMARLGYRPDGFNDREIKYLKTLAATGRPTGIKHLSEALNEDPVTLESVIEPWLLRAGYIALTQRGREILPPGQEVIGKDEDAG